MVRVLTLLSPTEVVYGAMIPEPDYSDDEREAAVTKQAALVSRNNQVNA